MEKELNTEKLIPGLFAQVQAMDAVITALLQTHPNRDELAEAMKESLAMTTSHVANRLVQKGLGQDIAERIAVQAKNRLAAME